MIFVVKIEFAFAFGVCVCARALFLIFTQGIAHKLCEHTSNYEKGYDLLAQLAMDEHVSTRSMASKSKLVAVLFLLILTCVLLLFFFDSHF